MLSGKEEPVDQNDEREAERHFFEEQCGKEAGSGKHVAAYRPVFRSFGADKEQKTEQIEERRAKIRERRNPRGGFHVQRVQRPKQGPYKSHQGVR